VRFAGLNLRTFSGVPAWSNVHARIVEGITDMMIYVTFEGIGVLRGVGILVLMLLREKAEEDAINTAHTKCSSAEHRVSNTPCSAEHRVFRFPARPHIFWSYLTSSEVSSVFYCSLPYRNNEFVKIRQGWDGREYFAAMESFLLNLMSSVYIAHLVGLDSPSLE
jgi:hypothetical protein